MQVQRFSLFLVALVLTGPAWPGATARLSVAAAPAVARIAPLEEERRLVHLPVLQFEFAIEADCGPDHAVKSVSISVADTRRTLTGDTVPADAIIHSTLSVPARQIPPVAVENFCPISAAAPGGEQRLIRDVATAHVSLRCAGPDGDSISYASRSLDVTLVCGDGSRTQSEPTSTDR